MGAETANVNLGTPGSRDVIRTDLRDRPVGWLADAARSLAELLEADWSAWRSAGGAGGFSR
jgi:hypothetical protein